MADARDGVTLSKGNPKITVKITVNVKTCPTITTATTIPKKIQNGMFLMRCGVI